MTATYEKIATNTLGSNTTSITFSGITQTYTDLVIIIGNAKTTVNTDGPILGFNADTGAGTNYSWTFMQGNGSTAYSSRASNLTYGQNYLSSSAMSNVTPGQLLVNIMNYSNSTTYKTTLTRSGSASNATEAWVNLWRSTAAITSVTLGVQSPDQWQSGTIFTMYGIKAE